MMLKLGGRQKAAIPAGHCLLFAWSAMGVRGKQKIRVWLQVVTTKACVALMKRGVNENPEKCLTCKTPVRIYYQGLGSGLTALCSGMHLRYIHGMNIEERNMTAPGWLTVVTHCPGAVHLVALIVGIAFYFLPAFANGAQPFHFDDHHDVLGRIGRYTIKNDESLYELARTYKTGFNEMVEANPGIDPYVPGKGTSLVLPTSWILPDTSRAPGIVINVSEMRLYYYFKRGGRVLVKTYPIGIGDEGKETPLGTFRIIEKIAHPAWHVPESIRKEKPELPAVVPSGPDNPMGSHALRLSLRTVLIHGTDVPWGIGRRVSHGCIRLYPEDITELFHLVPVNTRVTIIQQPVKAGVSNGRVFVEVNEDSELKTFDYLRNAKAMLETKGLFGKVNFEKLVRAVKEKKGYPVDVSLAK